MNKEDRKQYFKEIHERYWENFYRNVLKCSLWYYSWLCRVYECLSGKFKWGEQNWKYIIFPGILINIVEPIHFTLSFLNDYFIELSLFIYNNDDWYDYYHKAFMKEDDFREYIIRNNIKDVRVRNSDE